MVKTCLLCNNRIKENEAYCWVHNDKPKKINKKKVKKESEEMLREYGKKLKTGYLNQLTIFRDDNIKHFEKERRKFKKIEEHHNQIMKIWEELFDEEYQVIPNKWKKIMQNSN